MTYTRAQANWQNDAIGGTPINRIALNTIEAGVVNVDGRVTTIETLPGTNQGALIVSGAGGILTRQLIGTDGQVLTADHAQTTGMKWATPASSGGGTVTSVTAGDASILIAGTSTAPTVAINATGTPSSTTFLRGDRTWATAGSGAGLPLTTMGDLVTMDNTVTVVRKAVGSNGQVPTADSTVNPGTGWKWADPHYGSVQDEGTDLTQRAKLNFVGAGVTATDSGGLSTTVTIPGGGGTSAWTTSFTEDTSNTTRTLVTIPTGGGHFMRTSTNNAYFGINDETTNNFIELHLLIIQNSVGGWFSEFPGAFHWKGVQVNSLGQPMLITAPNTLTFIKLTWLGIGNGYLAEV